MHAQGDVLNVSLDLSEDHTPALNCFLKFLVRVI